eukprot:jgi/Hompol1/6570/HPOL_002285-RA
MSEADVIKVLLAAQNKQPQTCTPDLRAPFKAPMSLPETQPGSRPTVAPPVSTNTAIPEPLTEQEVLRRLGVSIPKAPSQSTDEDQGKRGMQRIFAALSGLQISQTSHN